MKRQALAPEQVRTTLADRADYPVEVDAVVPLAKAEAVEALARWQGGQRLLGR